MNSYQSLRQQNNRSTFAVVTLALCVLLSATVLFSRLMGFAPADTRHYIPLTQSGGITTVREGLRRTDGTIAFHPTGYHPGNHQLLTAQPAPLDQFSLVEKNKKLFWEGMTDIEIFRISYENGSQNVTVRSENGEKVIAPGTDNTYRFALENTTNIAVKYTMKMEAWFGEEGQEDPVTIPVLARVTDHKGNYLAGTASEKADVLELNKVSQEGSLLRGYVVPYTLEWEWPFEGDDAYDTMLGNLAVDEDITLTIRIITTATYDSDPGPDSGVPKTGDTSGIELAVVMMTASSAGLLFLLILPRRKRRERNV